MPRNAAELRAAATATGYFNGPQLQYVGDGFSVPWETGTIISPAFAGSMWIFKAYLDANYLEASRLHDWLYTPYGPGLINATQDEADLALREEVAVGDPVSAEVVYQACRTFGGTYFGRSVIGWAPIPTSGPADNIGGTALPGRNLAVADFKVVIVFQQTSTAAPPQPSIGYSPAPRTGGWTESYWHAGTTLTNVINTLKGPRTDGPSPILPARANILNAGARILGVRIYEGGVGRGEFRGFAYPGVSGGADVPSMSLLCASSVPTSLSVRRFTIRGIPDTQVSGGEFNPDSTYVFNLRVYFESLLNTSYIGLLPQTSYDIHDITTGGLLTATAAVPYGVGAFVYVSRTLTAAGRRYSNTHRVTAIGPGVGQLTLADWNAGPTTGGKLTTQVKQFFTLAINSTTAVRITNHKVGRPFAGYRGRSSRRVRT